MAESNIQMHTLIFQCGWETNSIHNIFSYILTSLSNDMKCGNNHAPCLFKQLNEVYWGVPPTLDGIKTEPDLVNLLVDLIFVYRTQLTKK